MKHICVIDYGMSNLLSVSRALEACGFEAEAVSSPDALNGADGIVLPGVGAFGDGMHALEERGFPDALRECAGAGVPLLGICLGMQMLFDSSEESPGVKGLHLIPGKVRRLPSQGMDGSVLRIPHVGWSPVRARPGGTLLGSALEHLEDGSELYFVHSYAAQPEQVRDALALAFRGGVPLCAAAQRGNVLGCQFHPEKSGPAGLAILKRFFT